MEPMKPMKLSEAIRLGAMLRPVQEFNVLFDPTSGGTCALGAAAEALGILDLTTRNNYIKGKKVPRAWHWIKRFVECPVCGEWSQRVDDMIAHVNNQHEWTRERIADWVATMEEAQSADAVPKQQPLRPNSPSSASPWRRCRRSETHSGRRWTRSAMLQIGTRTDDGG
jgi:uncharacterized C2H2 Zn-finger protein